MKSCKNCIHWMPRAENDKTAECAKVFFMRGSFNAEIPDDALGMMVHYDGGSYDSFETGRDFCCIHHREK